MRPGIATDLHLTAPETFDVEGLAAAFAAVTADRAVFQYADVAFVPGVPFYPGDPDPRTLRLSFSEPTPDRIVEGVRRLAAVL